MRDEILLGDSGIGCFRRMILDFATSSNPLLQSQTFAVFFGIKCTLFVGSRALASCIRPRSASSISSTMSVSAEEVAKHNTDKDCWVIVGDQVLDVTNFLSRSDSDQFLLHFHLFSHHVVRIALCCNRDAGASYFFLAMCFI